jgi:hypothetical protein
MTKLSIGKTIKSGHITIMVAGNTNMVTKRIQDKISGGRIYG